MPPYPMYWVVNLLGVSLLRLELAKIAMFVQLLEL